MSNNFSLIYTQKGKLTKNFRNIYTKFTKNIILTKIIKINGDAK
jgi:hypothetical protein